MKILVGLIVAVAIVGGLYVVNKDDAPTDTSEEQMMENDSMMESESEQFTGSLKELIALGKDYRCTFTHTTEQATSDGTVYISGENIRGDFTSSVEAIGGFTVESHMIKKGDTVYTWSPLSPNGFQVDVSEENSADVDGNTEASAAMELQDTELVYDCQPHSPDPSLFETPSNIEFMVLGEAMAQ